MKRSRLCGILVILLQLAIPLLHAQSASNIGGRVSFKKSTRPASS